VGRLSLWAPENDGIVPVVNSVDANDAVVGIPVLVKPHPFTVGTFFGKLIRGNKAFERDLSMGWNR
jgi:hypothetical protein